MSTISPSDARAGLPNLSYEDVLDVLASEAAAEDMLVSFVDLIYLNYLVSRGDLPAVTAFLEDRSVEERRHLVNSTSYHTHFGNSLQVCAYWNTGEAALEMFAFLIECGAQPIRDYYENLPWEMDGILYVPVIPIREIDEHPRRNRADFVETHRELRARYTDLVDPAIRVRPTRDGGDDDYDDGSTG